MTLSVDHIHHLDRHLVSEGEDHRSMALWVPSERVAVHRIDAPTAPQRKWAELIPWILEDRLLQPVEDMHFVIGAVTDKDDKKQVDITVVSKQDMFEWLRIAGNASVTPSALVPDYFALPYEEGRISMVWREGAFLVRDAAGSGFSASPILAWSLVRRLIDAADIAPRLSISVPDETLVPEDFLEEANINAADLDWQFCEYPLSANLLSGEFASTATRQANSGSWLSTAALFVLALVLGFGYLQVSNAQLEETVADLERQVSSGFGNVFSGEKAPPDEVRTSGELLLANLFKQRESLEAPAIRALVGLEQFMTACNCDLESLSVNATEIQLELKNASKLQVATLKVPGFKVSSKKVGEITSINFLGVDKS
jgi:general secretion pathway protein L